MQVVFLFPEVWFLFFCFRQASTQSIQMKDAAVMLSKFIVILRRMQLV